MAQNLDKASDRNGQASDVADGYRLLDPADYFSRELAAQEEERLWSKVWLMACREQELPNAGDFVTFEIGRESILIVRSEEGTINAFYNVCQHRGRRLKSGSGNVSAGIFCPFHAWRYDIDGKIASIPNHEDWDSVAQCNADLTLKSVRVDVWGGWVWVTMDPAAPPLLEFLDPVPDVLRNFDFEDCKIAWHSILIFPCNWKLVIDAFNEAYHVEGTHPQIMKYGRPKSLSKAFGDHGWFGYPSYLQTFTAPDPAVKIDYRQSLLSREMERMEWLKCLTTEYSIEAARRLFDILPEDAPYPEVLAKHRQLHRQVMEESGATWPERLTPDDLERAGVDWHIFPNSICLPVTDGAEWYRCRPNGNDPESCIFDIWWLQRYGKGKEPPIRHDYYPNLEDFKGKNRFLEQDFGNLIANQLGVHSRGFTGGRTNPVQEVAVANFHRALHDYLGIEPNEGSKR